jgi:hypothetical protein
VPASPRRDSQLLRSFILGESFVADGDEHSPLAERLSAGEDFAGSDGMGIVKQSLSSLIDPASVRGSLGTQLMLPVHQSLLWYDARKRSSRWVAQYVLMRGTGITLARFLLKPPAYLSDLGAQAADALARVESALAGKSPYGPIAGSLASAESGAMIEQRAWNAADSPELEQLGRRLIRHCSAVMSDDSQPPEVRLLHLRRIVALDVAWHMLNSAWNTVATPEADRYLLVCHEPRERAANRARVLSEESYLAANQALTRGLIAELRKRMTDHASRDESWESFFLQRSGTSKSYYEDLAAELRRQGKNIDLAAAAGKAFEAPGDGFVRPVGAFRVMLESCGLVRGTGRWRYLRATPDLLAAMVAARPESGPQEAADFLTWLRSEWSLVVGEQELHGARLHGEGSVLQRNATHFERDLVDARLATALSDQTCMVAMNR